MQNAYDIQILFNTGVFERPGQDSGIQAEGCRLREDRRQAYNHTKGEVGATVRSVGTVGMGGICLLHEDNDLPVKWLMEMGHCKGLQGQ